MIKMTENMVVADNEVILNGVRFMVNDDLAEKIYSMIKGDANMRTVSTPQTVYTASTASPVAPVSEKKPYIATKDFKPQYEIKEQTATDGTKLYCISRKNGWTKAEKSLMNGAIKANLGKEVTIKVGRKNVKDTMVNIKVGYTDKDGKTKQFDAWGYKEKAIAEHIMAQLPAVFTVAQLNGEA